MTKRLILRFATVIASAIAVTSVHSAAAAGIDTTPAINADDKNFEKGKKAIEAKTWNDAIEAFKKVIADNADNADAHNYLGYAYRWTNRMDESFKHYNIALKLSPNHRGAHEYIGVAYLKVNQPEKAKEHLAKLEKICGKKCEEYEDLAKALAAYQPAKK
jgi:tetratricopeptide (TPR) repeat protein